ncbi:MAG: hypothetical protein GDA55_07000 [Cellvibrionales bacterium]|nr:hypothetical protein [Cellvibrionales bacterium]
MAKENNYLKGVTRKDIENGIIYERDEASVLVQNDVPGGEIPVVGDKQIAHTLDVSASLRKQVQIISGERGPSHPMYRAGSPHAVNGAIDVKISGLNSEQVANTLYSSGHFSRVASYTDGRISAHADYRPSDHGRYQGRKPNQKWIKVHK